MRRMQLVLAAVAFLAWGIPSQTLQAQDSPVQVGLVNVISQGNAFPVLPIVNWSFSFCTAVTLRSHAL